MKPEDINVTKVTRDDFSMRVKSRVAEDGSDWLDAILSVAAECKIEVESVPRLLTVDIKEMLEDEVSGLNLIKGGERHDKLSFK